MYQSRWKSFGPFDYFRLDHIDNYSFWLRGHEDANWGFEWGYEDGAARRCPLLRIRVGKLVVFSIELWCWGWELTFLGWWWIK